MHITLVLNKPFDQIQYKIKQKWFLIKRFFRFNKQCIGCINKMFNFKLYDNKGLHYFYTEIFISLKTLPTHFQLTGYMGFETLKNRFFS